MKVAFSGSLNVPYEIKRNTSVPIANGQSVFNKTKFNIKNWKIRVIHM